MELELMTEWVRDMLQSNVFMDPLLVHTHFPNDSGVPSQWAARGVDRLYSIYVQLDRVGAALADLPFSCGVMRMCLRETLLSTAVLSSYTQTGSVVPQAEDLEGAFVKVNEFVSRVGAEGLYQIYVVVAGYDLMQPFYHERQVPEAEFLDGIRHHPYRQETLDLFLMMTLAIGTLRLKPTGRERVLQLTRKGAQIYRWVATLLERSGYIARRMALSHVYQFDYVEEWDQLCHAVWPDAEEVRRKYVEWLNLPQRSQVLEVACRTGEPTFNGERFEAIHHGGRLTVADASQLPFPDASFDIAWTNAFLYYPVSREVIREMTRVVRPGGIVSVQQGLEVSIERSFFREWFEPVYEISGKRTPERPNLDFPPTADVVIKWLAEAGLTRIRTERMSAHWIFDESHIVVQHLLRVVGFLRAELMSLPWDYQRTLIMELVDRGRDVCRKYSLSERTVPLPCVMVKAIRPG